MARKLGLGGSFGARYGTLARRQYVDIVTGMRRKHECPRCKFRTVKRRSVGIWLCRKCGYKFAGGAYSPLTKLGEVAARATRGQMSPSTLSTELDSLRAGATVAPSVAVKVRKARAPRRRKVIEKPQENEPRTEEIGTTESPAMEENPGQAEDA